MHHDATIPFLGEIVLFLVVAAILVPLFHRARVSPVLGFLLAGVVIGPHGLGLFVADAPWLRFVTIDEVRSVATIAEFGVVFLLFVIGLEMSFARLWAMRKLVLGFGAAQVGITALVIGLVAWGWGNAPAAAVLIGASFALSSTAVVLEELIQRAEFPTRAGRATFSVLLFQDLSVVPLLVLVSVLGGDSQHSFAWSMTIGFATALGTAAALYLLGRVLLRPVFRLAAAVRAPEFFVAITLLTAIGAAATTAAAGLSLALGAFLAGLLLADTEYRHQIEVDIAPIKGLLMGLFFLSVGMSIDTREVAHLGVWVALSVAALVAIKAVIATVLGRLFGLSWPVSIHVGLLLGQGGEFALLVVGMAMGLGVMPVATGQFMLIVVSLSLLVTPGLAALGKQLAMALERRAPPPDLAPERDAAQDLEGHVVIAGYGRVGMAVTAMLLEERIAWVAVDQDAARVAQRRLRGEPVYFGDGRRAEVLQRVGAARAVAIVLTLDDGVSTEKAVHQIRLRWPHVPIFARSRDRAHAARLEAAGVTRTVPELSESSLQLGAAVLAGVGVPDEAVNTLVARVRERGYDGM